MSKERRRGWQFQLRMQLRDWCEEEFVPRWELMPLNSRCNARVSMPSDTIHQAGPADPTAFFRKFVPRGLPIALRYDRPLSPCLCLVAVRVMTQ